MLWVFLAVWILQLCHPCVLADKHFALLQGTLKTFQKAVCDDQQVSLRCPPGTCISVLIAQYGSSNQALQELCPDLRAAAHPRANLTCVWPTSLQYSLLQTVMEACHKKRQCKFHVTSNTFSGDPCPGFRKYIEVAYKCRPYEFRSKMACQDDTLQLTCNPHSRVAVYSASFGRTEYESVRCPQPQGVREETCLANYATETVMEICHGKRQCSVTADANTFSNPCSRHSRTYLKVVYTCVPKTVLRQQPEDQVNDDERTEPDYDVDYDDSLDNSLQENHVYSESPKMAVAGGRHNSSGLVVSSLPASTEGTPYPSIGSEDDFTETRSRLILGLVFAITCGLVLLAALVTTRYCFGRQRCRAPKEVPDSGLTKGYLEDVSEDVEIDLTTPSAITVLPTSHHASPQEVIRYKGEAPLSMGLTSSADYCYG